MKWLGMMAALVAASMLIGCSGSDEATPPKDTSYYKGDMSPKRAPQNPGGKAGGKSGALGLGD